MLKTFSDLARNIHFQPKFISIDNAVFQLHYRLTFWILLVCTVLVTSRQYIGEHIRCISDHVANHVINTFCFFTTTFTVVRHFNDTEAPHPGVGPINKKDIETGSIIHHAYYQWVPFVLFGQALMFYLPHRFWRSLEGGTLRMLVAGLENSYLALEDTQFDTRFGVIPPRSRVRQRIEVLEGVFLSRLRLNQYWGYNLIFCEMLNGVNLLLQWVITNKFLGGAFLTLGPWVVRAAETGAGPDPLDVVFPKVTKCTFYKYGPSGSIQLHDALCVMALNVINEKIYTFLWFWFVFLSVATGIGILWRLLTLLCFSRSLRFSAAVFRINPRHDPELDDAFAYVMRRCEFSHWIFLYYLNKNLHTRTCDEFFRNLAQDWREQDLSQPDSPILRGPNGYGYKDATLPLSSRPVSMAMAGPMSASGMDSEKGPLLESLPSSASRRGSSPPSPGLSDRSDRSELDEKGKLEKERPHHE